MNVLLYFCLSQVIMVVVAVVSVLFVAVAVIVVQFSHPAFCL